MKLAQTKRLRLTLDIAVKVNEIDPAGPGVADPNLAGLCARVQAAVLKDRALLDRQIDLELFLFLDGLNRDDLMKLLGFADFDPYEQHPELWIEAAGQVDANVLRTVREEGSLGMCLDDLTQSFRAEITSAAIERLD
jgi:hypothetical protein